VASDTEDAHEIHPANWILSEHEGARMEAEKSLRAEKQAERPDNIAGIRGG
jgi:hypothetical protein